MTHYQDVLDQIEEAVRPILSKGKVASYIPALAKVPQNQFSMAIYTIDGQVFSVGDTMSRFTIQSVSKVMTLALAMDMYGDSLWQRVGKEPSGTAFNSLTQLEYEQGIPRNPFINAGAIVVADALISRLSSPIHTMVETFRTLAGSEEIHIDKEVAESEFSHRHRNAAMAHLMCSFGNFENEVEDVLRAYFNFCATKMNTIEIAKAYGFLANKGRSEIANRQVLTGKQNNQLNSLLFTSGLYDASGDFAYRVGMPGKSGVSGAILAIAPECFTVAVWAPGLNDFGNSIAGLHALGLLSDKLQLSLF